MKNKYIALDLGNCCIAVDTNQCLKRLGLQSIEDVPKDFLFSCEKFECGLISKDEWLCDFRKATGDKLSDDYLIKAWNSIIQDEIEGMAETISYIVSKGYRIALLSDTSELHLDYSLKKLSFAKYFSGGTYSFKVGARKPSEIMYRTFEKEFGIPLIYTDDKIENIHAASRLGWNSYLFENAAGFLEAFKKTNK